MSARNVILALYAKYGGDWDEIYYIIKNKIRLQESEIDSLLASLGNLEDYISIVDADYPEECKRMRKPPFVIKRSKQA